MERVKINNLGIPPLAGLCTYEEACRVGYAVDDNVSLLKRYNYVNARLNSIMVVHIPRTPEWEVKCALGLHMWLVAEHSNLLRKRVSEMREPPLHMDKVPDLLLEASMEEVIRAENSVELLVGIYRVVFPELVRSLQKHLDETNPMMDQPTCRIFKIMLMEEKEMIAWGEQAITALTHSADQKEIAQKWEAHLRSYLIEAKGISGDLTIPEGHLISTPRSDGLEYKMDPEPRRDERFVDPFNQSALIDKYYLDESLEYDERTYALLYKRLREMDVPEYMAPMIYNTKGKPWEYYSDLSRQLWDEARHAMMGEVGLYQDGIPFYKYPIDLKTSMTANLQLEPLQAHLILTGIELSLMPKATGKRLEWKIAKTSGNELAATIQDYDWADEVLHAQIGRKWLIPVYGSLEKLQTAYEELWPTWWEMSLDKKTRSEQKEWWDSFIQDIRKTREKVKSLS